MATADGTESVPDDAAESLPREVDRAPEGAPEDIRSVSSSVTAVSITRQVQWLMPSLVELIGELADRHPDIAVTITEDIVERRRHRERLEERVIDGDNRRADRGQIISWLFAMLALVLGFVLITADRSASGFVLVITAVVPLMSVNLIGRLVAARERSQRLRLSQHQDTRNASSPSPEISL